MRREANNKYLGPVPVMVVEDEVHLIKKCIWIGKDNMGVVFPITEQLRGKILNMADTGAEADKLIDQWRGDGSYLRTQGAIRNN